MITAALPEDLEDAIACIRGSKIHDEYFQDDTERTEFFRAAIEKGELAVLRENEGIIGIAVIDLNGMFSEYPLLRLIGVHEQHRGNGHGAQLLTYYDTVGFRHKERIFLVVANWNTKARALYERHGYVKVGEIEGLYHPTETESIMMKVQS